MIDEQPSDESRVRFRSGFSIFPAQVMKIEALLKELRADIPARYLMLVDSSGQYITSVGGYQTIDTDALGSLIAGDLAASQEIARMTGEYQDFQSILREGERSHIIISEAGKFLVVFAQFSKDVPLGWARRLIKKAAQELGNIVLSNSEDAATAQNELGQDNLPEQFIDALDDIWKG